MTDETMILKQVAYGNEPFDGVPPSPAPVGAHVWGPADVLPPAPSPGQNWAPTRAGSRAKAREVAGVSEGWVCYWRTPYDLSLYIQPRTWRRWVRSCDARVVVIPDYCPVCGGDCASANPPVLFCPMKDGQP